MRGTVSKTPGISAYAGFMPFEAHFAVSEVAEAIVFGTSVILAYLAL